MSEQLPDPDLPPDLVAHSPLVPPAELLKEMDGIEVRVAVSAVEDLQVQ